MRIANYGFGFAVSVVLARALGPHGYGIYTTAFVVAATLAILVQLGLPSLVMRETATALADGDGPRMAAIWAWANRKALVISFALVVAGGFLYFFRDHSATEIWAYALALAFVPFVALSNIRAGALRGLHHVVLAQFPEQAVKPGAMLIMALSLGSLLPASPSVAMGMRLLSIVLAFVVGAIFLRQKRPVDSFDLHLPRPQVSLPSFRSVAAFAFVAGATNINQYTDVLTISLFCSPEKVGVYRAVWQCSMLISFGSATAAAVITPLFARYHHQGDRIALFGALRKARLLSLAIALPGLLLILLFGEKLINHLFGAGFTEGVPVLVLLAIMQTVNALFGPLGSLLNMMGREATSGRLHILAAGVNVVLNLILVPLYGIMGAATATFASYIILNTALIWVAQRQ